jgi:hypothetical protein
MGFYNGNVALPNQWARELDLFGDFKCDVAVGDSDANAYTLIEFEDATEFSIFSRLKPNRTMRRWSPRFEHGFSQLVDWAWRLSAEGESAAYRRIFGDNHVSCHLMLVAGRDSDLSRDDRVRLQWRSRQTTLGSFHMSCMTFDEVLRSLRSRIRLAHQRLATT